MPSGGITSTGHAVISDDRVSPFQVQDDTWNSGTISVKFGMVIRLLEVLGEVGLFVHVKSFSD